MKLAAHPRARQGAIPNGTPADTAPSFPPLPVRAAPAGDILPQIVIDTREQTPLTFRSLPSRPGTLTQGDYSVAGLESDFAVERKSLPDLVASLTRERERFMREVDRLRGCPFARLLVIGSEADLAAERYRSNANPTALLHGLHSIEARGLPVVFAGTPEAAAALVERWAWWRARAVLQAANALLRESDRATCTPPPVRNLFQDRKGTVGLSPGVFS